MIRGQPNTKVNIYASNNGAPKYTRQILTNNKGGHFQ